MTILAIQATSIPSERMFSSASQTDTAERNRLSPIMKEMLQILKFNIRNNVINIGRAHFMDNPDDFSSIIMDEVEQDEVFGTVAP